jgi:Holliday junction resolvase RusA-like endonuclease
MKLVLQGRLPSLNDYINSCRRNRYDGANLKKVVEEYICCEIKKQTKDKFDTVALTFSWYEANKKRDLDNIAFAKKFILDALQTTDTLTGDGWGQVIGFSDEFYVDKENPRVEIEIKAVG